MYIFCQLVAIIHNWQMPDSMTGQVLCHDSYDHMVLYNVYVGDHCACQGMSDYIGVPAHHNTSFIFVYFKRPIYENPPFASFNMINLSLHVFFTLSKKKYSQQQ
jgi:hypothetical protein